MEELPGANTQGRNLEETKNNLIEAIQLVLEANREPAEEEQVGANAVNSLERCGSLRSQHPTRITQYDRI